MPLAMDSRRRQAWNFHWLPPEFLTEHEEELIDLLLATYAAHGHKVSGKDFVR